MGRAARTNQGSGRGQNPQAGSREEQGHEFCLLTRAYTPPSKRDQLPSAALGRCNGEGVQVIQLTGIHSCFRVPEGERGLLLLPYEFAGVLCSPMGTLHSSPVVDQPGPSNSEVSCGEEKACAAESAEDAKHKDDLEACQGSQPKAGAEPLTPCSPDSTGKTQVTLRALQMEAVNRTMGDMTKYTSGLMLAAC